jgi:hypothetical protein
MAEGATICMLHYEMVEGATMHAALRNFTQGSQKSIMHVFLQGLKLILHT